MQRVCQQYVLSLANLSCSDTSRREVLKQFCNILSVRCFPVIQLCTTAHTNCIRSGSGLLAMVCFILMFVNMNTYLLFSALCVFLSTIFCQQR